MKNEFPVFAQRWWEFNGEFMGANGNLYMLDSGCGWGWVCIDTLYYDL